MGVGRGGTPPPPPPPPPHHPPHTKLPEEMIHGTNIVDIGLKVLFFSVFFAIFWIFFQLPPPPRKRLKSAIFRCFFPLDPWKFLCRCPCAYRKFWDNLVRKNFVPWSPFGFNRPLNVNNAIITTIVGESWNVFAKLMFVQTTKHLPNHIV